MDNNLKQDSIKEMLNMLKGDYNTPARLWVWGKVIKEWAGIIVGVTLIFLIALGIVFAIKGEGGKVEYVNGSQQAVSLPMKDIVKFMAICQRSFNKRQEILEYLMKDAASYKNEKLDKENIEQKIKTFSLTSSTCNSTWGFIMSQFTRARNPFENPGVSKAFDELIEDKNDLFKENNKVLNPQLENEEWGKLCALCQNEVTKANNELIQILKNGEGVQK